MHILLNRIDLQVTRRLRFNDLMVPMKCGKEGNSETFGSKIFHKLHHGSHVTLRWIWNDKSMQQFGIESHLILRSSFPRLQSLWYIQMWKIILHTKLNPETGRNSMKRQKISIYKIINICVGKKTSFVIYMEKYRSFNICEIRVLNWQNSHFKYS